MTVICHVPFEPGRGIRIGNEMDDALGTDATAEDIGMSTMDVQAIKASILRAVQEGHVEPGDISVLTQDLMNAFKDLDDQVVIRSTITDAEVKKHLTPAAK